MIENRFLAFWDERAMSMIVETILRHRIEAILPGWQKDAAKIASLSWGVAEGRTIEHCAAVCDELGAKDCAAAIRALIKPEPPTSATACPGTPKSTQP